jgi:Domain of unknown function (DUF4260)
MVTGILKRILQAEGAALLIAATAAYHLLDVSWWMFAVLFFAPDLSFIAYLAGPKLGAIAYNTLHSTIGPLLLACAGLWLGFDILGTIVMAVALIWLAHVGFDRMLGYGLKHASGFKDTHLGKL